MTQLVEALSGKGGTPGQRIPQRDPQRIDVGACVHRLTCKLLRASKSRRSHKAPVRQVDLARGGGGLRQTEVDHLHFQPGRRVPGTEHEVAGLQITVDDALSMGGIEHARDRSDDFQGLS